MLLVVGISVRTYRVTVGADRKKRLVRIAQSGTITLTDVINVSFVVRAID